MIRSTLTAILLFFLFLGCNTQSIEKPNILLIMVDDLNDYNEDLMGHPQVLTPNIKKFSETALSFTNAYSNVVSSFFGVKFQRSIEELLVSPMPSYLILIGFIMGGVIRGIIVGFLVLLTSLIFTDISIQNIP